MYCKVLSTKNLVLDRKVGGGKILLTIRERVGKMALKKFNKNEINRKNILMIVGVFMVVGILLLKTSYAVYQKEDEVQFINAKVRWPKASEVTYTNTSNSSVTNIEQALNDLYGKLGK